MRKPKYKLAPERIRTIEDVAAVLAALEICFADERNVVTIRHLVDPLDAPRAVN